MAGLELDCVGKRFGRVRVLDRIDLTIADGEFVVIVGPSGCGKSTLLRLIAGLEDISEGELHIGDRRVNDLPPAERGVAMVFQSYALYPHMTAYQNIAFGLKLARAHRGEIDRRVRDAAALLEIAELLDRKPRELSGGQRQRVAIGRAIVRDPQVFLFDEPLSNLDASLRTQMRAEIARLQERLGVTTVYVTHDQVEAMTLAERIVVLREGHIEQVGAPLELYDRPATQFVAGFIGSPRMNFLDVEIAEVDGGKATCLLSGGHRLEVRLRQGAAPPDGHAVLGIRPEHLSLWDMADLPARVELIEELGEAHHLHLVLEGGGQLIVKRADSSKVRRDEIVQVGIDRTKVHLFDNAGQAIGES